MLFTIEEIKERQNRKHPSMGDCNFVIINKKQEIVFYGRCAEVIDWVKKNCYKKLELDSDYSFINYPWSSRIPEWIGRSVDTKQKYKGYHFHYYDKKWERIIKIKKLINENE